VKTLADILWTIVRWLLPLTVAGLVVATALSTGRIHEEVRRRIESRLREEFPALAIRVQAASLVEGEGIVARGVSFTDPALPPQYRQLVWIEELRLACGTNLADLAAGPPRITAVHVRRPVVHAFRAADGRWPLAALVRGGGRGLAVTVAVEDATLHVEDAASGARLVLRQIALQVGPDREAAGGAVVRGSVAGDLFERAGFEGRLTTVDGGFALNGAVESLDLSPQLRGLLRPGGQAAEWLASARGRLDFSWRASGSLAALDAVDFAATGRLEAGHVEHPRLPFAATNVTAAFAADRTGIVCEQFAANAGSTLLRGSGRTRGWSLQSDFDLVVEAERLLVGRQWEGLLPEALVAHWSKLLPAGEVDVRAGLLRRSGVVEPDVAVRCRNVSLTYYRFPYRVDRTVGTVTLKGDSLALHLTGEAGGHPVRVEGMLRTSAGTPGHVEVRGDGMQIDDALLAALPPRSADIVRSLRAAGSFDFVFRHDRAPREPGGFANSLGIRLAGCSVAYAGFPYPLTNVCGNVVMDRGRWTIKEITGCNDSGVIRCTGGLERIGEDDGELTLRLAGSDVVLERELRDALPPGMRRIWDDLEPRGNAEFTALVRHRVKQRRTEVELAAMPRGDTVSIEPSWFPYRLERLKGRLAWKDGQLRFEEVRGAHARTSVSAEGTCRFTPDGGWHVSFARLAADRFRADHDVLQALPAGLRQVVSGVRLGGLLSVDGAIDIYSTAAPPAPAGAGRSDPVPGPAAAAWDVVLDMEQAGLDVGVPLEHVHGTVRLRGQADGRGWRSTGDLVIDSAMWHGVQVSGVRGPVALDAAGARFGVPAGSDGDSAARSLAARIAGGTLLVDGHVTAGESGRFSVTATLADADLERLAGDVSGGPNRYRGRVHGGVEVTGSRAGAHSLAGRGQVRLRDADIYELPVMVALLKILRVKAPDRSAFSSSLIDFRIEGPRAYLDNIELSGDAISLVGAGEIDLDSTVKLTFRPIMGDAESQLPVMKRMLGGASGQFMLVHVDGTLSDPVPTTEAFPTLAAAVQRLQSQRSAAAPRAAGRTTEGGLR